MRCPRRAWASSTRRSCASATRAGRRKTEAMSDAIAAFVGKIPEQYDRYLAPLFFNPYADDLAARLAVTDDMQVLEVACGTGIVTRRLVERLGGRGSVVAPDINEGMFAPPRTRPPGRG